MASKSSFSMGSNSCRWETVTGRRRIRNQNVRKHSRHPLAGQLLYTARNIHDLWDHVVNDRLQVVINPILMDAQQNHIEGFATEIGQDLLMGFWCVARLRCPGGSKKSIMTRVQSIYFVGVSGIIQDRVHAAVIGIMKIKVLGCDDQTGCLLEIILK